MLCPSKTLFAYVRGRKRLFISITNADKERTMKQYILVGLGPHAKRIYYPFLEKHQEKYVIKLRLLIELDSQQSKVNNFVKDRSLKPEEIFFVEDNPINRLGKDLYKNLLRD